MRNHNDGNEVTSLVPNDVANLGSTGSPTKVTEYGNNGLSYFITQRKVEHLLFSINNLNEMQMDFYFVDEQLLEIPDDNDWITVGKENVMGSMIGDLTQPSDRQEDTRWQEHWPNVSDKIPAGKSANSAHTPPMTFAPGLTAAIAVSKEAGQAPRNGGASG